MHVELKGRRSSRHYNQIRRHGVLAHRDTLFAAISLCLLMASPYVWAQGTAVANPSAQTTVGPPGASNSKVTTKGDKGTSQKKPQELQAVTVVGIMRSVNRSIATKRDSTAIVDAISAEGVGKFPTNNVAGALQHVTGIEITRNRNGQGQYVTVRGLPTTFTLATLNGLTIATVDPTSRSFDFNLISPDFIQTIKVYKSSRADLDAGGIGANVDLETVTPFGIGKQRALLTAKLQGAPGAANNRNYPDITAIYSNVFDNGKFGATIGFDWNKRFFPNQLQEPTPFYKASINGKGPYLMYQETSYANQQSSVLTKTGYVSLQWKPVASTIATLTGFYAHRNSGFNWANFGVVPMEPYEVSAYNGPGAHFAADQNGVFTKVDTPIVAWTFYNNLFDDHSTLKNVSLKVDTNVGQWNFTEGLQWSEAHDNSTLLRPLLINSIVGGQTPTPNNPETGGYQIYPGEPVLGYIIPPSFKYEQTTSWLNQQFKNNVESGGDQIKSARVNITRFFFNAGPLQSIKFGAKAYRRGRPFNETQWVMPFKPGQNLYPFSAFETKPAWTQNVLSDYHGPGDRPANLFLINVNQWIDQNFGSLANFRKQPQIVIENSPGNHWNMIERGRGAYAMASFRFNGAIPVSGNVGARYVDTNDQFLYNGYNVADIRLPNCQIGIAGCEGAIFPPTTSISKRSSNQEILPSLNVEANLTNDMDLRFAASKTIALPPFTDMVPVPSISIDAYRISEGNVSLHPFSSINYGLSWEWYFHKSSMVSVAGYSKRIHGFIQQGASSLNISGHPFVVTLPVNGSKGQVQGMEIDYKQSFDFLPSFWSGFGFEANGTYSTGREDAAPQFNIVASPFPGLTKFTYNGTLFYQKYGFSGTLTLNHRGKYMINQNYGGNGTGQEFGAPRTQVDAQMRYAVNRYISVFLDMENILNKPIIFTLQRRNGTSTSYPAAWQFNARRVMAGFTFRF